MRLNKAVVVVVEDLHTVAVLERHVQRPHQYLTIVER